MKWLDTVNFNGLCGAMVMAAGRIERIYAGYGSELVVTSANDSTHKTGSRHYFGAALDFRTHHLDPLKKAEAVAMAKRALGPTFLVDLEDPGLPNEHLHVQFNG